MIVERRETNGWRGAMATELRGIVKRVDFERLQKIAWLPVEGGACEVSEALSCASNGWDVVSNEQTAWGSSVVVFHLFLHTSPSFDGGLP